MYVWPRLKYIPCISKHWFHMWRYFHFLFFKVVLNKYEMNIVDQISYCLNISGGFVQIVMYPT